MAQRKVGFFYLHSVNGEVNLDGQEYTEVSGNQQY